MITISLPKTLTFKVTHLFLGSLWGKCKRRCAKTFNRLHLKTANVDFYFQPNDPYNLLLLPALNELCKRYRITINPIVLGTPPNTSNSQKKQYFSYALQDVLRVAKALRIPLPSPMVNDIANSQQWLAIRILLRNQQAKTAVNILEVVSEALWTGHHRRLKQYALWHHSVTKEEAQKLLAQNAKQLAKYGHHRSGMLYFEGEWYNSHRSLHHLEAKLIKERNPDSKQIWSRPQKLQLKPSVILSDVTVQFYFSFNNPCSFIALNQLLLLSDHYRFHIEFRPVKLPPAQQQQNNEQYEPSYQLQEAQRDASLYNVNLGRHHKPKAKHEELMMAWFTQAQEQGQTRQWCVLALNAIWREDINLDDSQARQSLLKRSNINTGSLEHITQKNAWEKISDKNLAHLNQLKLWSTPAVQCEAFTSQGYDRLWLLEKYLLGQNEPS